MKTRVVVFALLLTCFIHGVKAQADCKTYAPTAATIGTGSVLSVVSVPDAFKLGSVAVQGVSLDAARVGDVKVSLSAGVPNGAAPRTVVVKDVSSGGDATSLTSTTWEDGQAAGFPADATGAPFTSVYTPAQALESLAKGDSNSAGDGGAQGVWVLRVADLQDASRTITLNGWTLQLCAAPAPAVTAQDGPVDTAVNTTTPVVPSANATIGAGETTEAEDQGLVEEFLSRLNTLSERDPLFANRTTVRESLAPSGNDTLITRLQDRLDSLLAPLNDTRLVRSLNGSRMTGGPGMVLSFLNSSDASPTPSNTTAGDEGVVVRFLSSFRDLVQSVTGGNTSSLSDGPSLRSAMAQSGVSLDGSSAGTLAGLLKDATANSRVAQWITDGPHPVYDALTAVFTAVTSGPVATAVRTGGQAVTNAVGDKLRSGAEDAAQAGGVLKTFATNNVKDAVDFWRGSKALASGAVTDHLTNYRDLVSASGALVQQVLKKRVDTLQSATTRIMDSATSGLEALKQLPEGPVRTKLSGLLSGQLASLSGLRAGAGGVGQDMSKVVTALTDALRTSVSSARGVAATAVNAGVDLAQSKADAQLRVAAGVLDRIDAGLQRMAQYKAGPVGSASLAAYQTGLKWLKDQLTSLRTAIAGIPPVTLDGTTAKNVMRGLGSMGAGKVNSALDNLRASVDRLQGTMGKLRV